MSSPAPQPPSTISQFVNLTVLRQCRHVIQIWVVAELAFGELDVLVGFEILERLGWRNVIELKDFDSRWMLVFESKIVWVLSADRQCLSQTGT